MKRALFEKNILNNLKLNLEIFKWQFRDILRGQYRHNKALQPIIFELIEKVQLRRHSCAGENPLRTVRLCFRGDDARGGNYWIVFFSSSSMSVKMGINGIARLVLRTTFSQEGVEFGRTNDVAGNSQALAHLTKNSREHTWRRAAEFGVMPFL